MFLKRYSSAVSFLIIIATVYFSFNSLTPKKISAADAPLTQFSTARAMTHLQEISKSPHFVNTNGHKQVQDYILKQLEDLGLETQVQQQVGVNKKWRAGSHTENILGRIKGTDNSKALMLLSHYDSNPHSSLGASDAGSGVVTILEGLRAYLAKGKKPKNDIIVLITDAEELGLLGADAFVNNHAWAKELGLVLNFEARGSGGPSYMLLETNGGNQELIRHFKKADSKFPLATSLMYSIYKMLPNDTDLTVFREDGDIDGFNFAFIDDHFDYHTAQDTYERLDKTSLEHQGSYLMPLLEYFANIELTNLKSESDSVYFNAPLLKMVSYPFSWILVLLIIAIALFLGLFFYGLSKHKINGKQALFGFVPFLLSLLLSGLLTVYGWKALTLIHPQYTDILQGFTYNGHFYIAAFAAITLAISFLIYSKFAKKTRVVDLIIAPLLFWLILNVLAFLYLEGAAYFIIPAFFGLIAMCIMLFSKKHLQNSQLFLTVLAIPVLMLFVPMVQMFPVGLGLKNMVLGTTIIVLLFGLLIPVFLLYKNGHKLGYLFMILAVIILISASFKSNYNMNKKKPNSIIYLKDADKNEAYWASYDRRTDGFTKQFFEDGFTKGSFDKATLFSKYNTQITRHTSTIVKDIPNPEYEINYDTIIEENRNISITIYPKRRIHRIEVMAENNIQFTRFAANGVDFKKSEGSEYVFSTERRKKVLSYSIANDEDLNLWFSVPKGQEPQLTLYEVSYDLLNSPYFNAKPLYHITPRSEMMIPKPFVINDAIIIKKQIDLNEN